MGTVIAAAGRFGRSVGKGGYSSSGPSGSRTIGREDFSFTSGFRLGTSGEPPRDEVGAWRAAVRLRRDARISEDGIVRRVLERSRRVDDGKNPVGTAEWLSWSGLHWLMDAGGMDAWMHISGVVHAGIVKEGNDRVNFPDSACWEHPWLSTCCPRVVVLSRGEM